MKDVDYTQCDVFETEDVDEPMMEVDKMLSKAEFDKKASRFAQIYEAVVQPESVESRIKRLRLEVAELESELKCEETNKLKQTLNLLSLRIQKQVQHCDLEPRIQKLERLIQPNLLEQVDKVYNLLSLLDSDKYQRVISKLEQIQSNMHSDVKIDKAFKIYEEIEPYIDLIPKIAKINQSPLLDLQVKDLESRVLEMENICLQMESIFKGTMN